MATNIEIKDILLKYFPVDYKGILLEVGTAHPVDISISHFFRPLGWQIISVEPNPDFCQEYRKRGFSVLEYAACSEDKGTATFKISPNLVSCSALEVKYAGWWPDDQFKTINVEALKLDTILERHHKELKKIDILMVDVEGWEIEVLKGFDLEGFNPKVVCLENCQSIPEYYSYMESKGYKIDKKEEQDEFYSKYGPSNR